MIKPSKEIMIDLYPKIFPGFLNLTHNISSKIIGPLWFNYKQYLIILLKNFLQ
jgi:hypothetical protein